MKKNVETKEKESKKRDEQSSIRFKAIQVDILAAAVATQVFRIAFCYKGHEKCYSEILLANIKNLRNS